MAPVQSKTAKLKAPEGPAAFVELVTVAVWEQFDRTLEDLADLAVFVADCCDAVGQEIGKVGQCAAEALGDAFTSAMRSLRCCTGASCWTGGKGVPLISTAPVLFVMQVISILYSSFVFVYMPAAGIALDSPISMLFHAFVFMILASIMQVYCTDPGGVPDTKEWRKFGKPPLCLKERKASVKGSARWCRKSSTYKPDRSHFCRATQTVVLRMDHHCPWLGSTIGHDNHKYFLLVLLYASSTCLLVDFSFLGLLLQATLPPSSVLLLLESAGISLLLSSLLLPFFAFHCWLLANNMTTIEFCERSTKAKQKQQDEENKDGAEDHAGKSAEAERDVDVENMYDIGLLGNVTSVLGNNPLTWLLPVGGPTGDGITFPTAADYTDLETFSEEVEVAELEFIDELEAETVEETSDEEAKDIPNESVAVEETCPWPSLADAASDILAGCNLLAEASQDAACLFADILVGSAPAPKRQSVVGKRHSRVHGLGGMQGFKGATPPHARVQVHGLGGMSSQTEVACSAEVQSLDLGVDVACDFLGVEKNAKSSPNSSRTSVASTTASVSSASFTSVASTIAELDLF